MGLGETGTRASLAQVTSFMMYSLLTRTVDQRVTHGTFNYN